MYSRKRSHKTLSIFDKLEILGALNKGESGSNLAKKYDIGSSTISDIKKSKEQIKR